MALRESESLLDDIPDGVLAVDVTRGTIQSVNDTCCTMLHREESTLVGLPLSEVATDGSSPIGAEAVDKARADGPVTLQWRAQTGHGTALLVESRLTTTTRKGQEIAVLTLREQPQRTAAEPPLERGRDRYRTLFDNDDLVLWEQDFAEARAYAMELADTGEELGTYLDAHPEELLEILARMEVHMVNDAALDFYGVDSKAELVANFDEMMVQDTREGLTAMWKAVVDGQRYFCTECKFRPLDGDEIRYELMEVYVPEAHADDYSLVFTTATDITEQKRREEELASAKERYRRILDRSSDYVLVCDEAGDIDYASPGIETTLGYEPDELEGTDAFEHVHPEDRDHIRSVFEEMLADPEMDVNVEYRVRTKGGSYRWVEARGGNYLDDPLIGGVMVTIRDIVERKQNEQALRAERDARSTLQRELADATSVEAFAGAVCAELVAMDAVTVAQVGRVTATDDIELLAADGPDGSCDSLAVPDGDRPGVTTAIAERDADPTRFPLTAGTDSGTGVVVPIVHDGVTRGVLVVHLASDRTLSDGRVSDLLGESADVLGYAMASDERRRALAADEWVELTATVQTDETPLSRAVAAAGTWVTVDGAVPRQDGAVLCHLTVEGDPAAFVDAAGDTDGIAQVERVGDGPQLQVVVTGSTPSAVVVGRGARLDGADVGPETTRLTVRLPEAASFDPVLGALTDRFDDVTIGEFTTAPTAPDRDDPLSGLTDRQREVLAVAYRGGYFEKPRTQNAGEVADHLDVARPTFDEVLRAAQRNLLETVFDEE
ncbi:PAS domain S-box protein [Haloarcula salinisoli]|uniref:PAS domain S-box protein n=1 Tax=Haloarcula salinisoli TaxID=2487746 RepID=A0A8J7YR15_9EURY|nr:PAS domain S-box protein [Halomicroarcula salinisoli]MBX0305768.1 PAS domain S-box protein [Halomicroarcula salinisoli]